jgi:hypothetical protein
MPDKAVEKNVFRRTQPDRLPTDEKIDLDEARPVTPFQIIRRGQDTIGEDDRVTFADFTPQVIPSDVQQDVEAEPVPKGESAPEPAYSVESTPTTVQPTLEPIVQQAAEELAAALDDGSPNPNETSTPSSSTAKKSGKTEPPA